MIEWQAPKARVWLRAVAFAVAAIFTTQDIVWADGGSFVESLAKRNETPVSVPSGLDWTRRDASSFFNAVSLPENLGQIKRNFQGSRDRIMIHVQDAHANTEAQKNIASVLDYFVKEHGLKLISLEGAEGELETELFSFFPNREARLTAAEYFLHQARLSGPEYLVMVDRPEVDLFGVEDRGIYEENRRAYLESLETKDRDEELLAGLNKVLEGVSRFVFSDELRGILRARTNFQEGGRELTRYVRALVESAKKNNVAIHDYPGMHSLLALVDLESQIDFEKAEKEIDVMISDLKNLLGRDKLSAFLTNTVQFRMKKMKRSDYYGYLQGEVTGMGAEDASLAKKYENVLSYLKYMQLYDAIGVDIFEEIENLETSIKNKLFRSEQEVQLDRILRIAGIYDKMFSFTLTKQDADFYYNYKDEFKVETFRDFLTPLLNQYQFSYGLPSQLEILDQGLARVERFYSAALKRDKILIERAVARMESTGQKVSAIVTGGFHTPGIEAYLREHDISYLVIAPRIASGIDEKKETALYEASLKQTAMPLEQRLVEAFQVPKSGQLNDPRFQLAAWHLMIAKGEVSDFLRVALSEDRQAMVKNPQFTQAFTTLSLTVILSLMLSA
ncbi:MAG: hypothetical protein FGM27_07065, partial [Candidatus Omnitrophica bacterium]|nr:hypothetical protein [Candidatus Omnitrophota bacterium]